MRVGIVGAGMLGLSLAHRLARLGHTVEVFEASPYLGGLACTHDYGSFFWDRFYHVILPTDAHLVGLVRELGLESDLRWRKTGTGYYARGRFHDMSGNVDFLRFPLLSLLDKARLAATVLYATRFADPWKLYQVSAAEWLARTCGRRCYEVFWRPLLKAKFGTFHEQVAAVFIWATLTRLFGARSSATSQEQMGYVRGGYRTILGRLEAALAERGALVRTSAPVARLARSARGACEVGWLENDRERAAEFDQVFFTGPTRLAEAIVAPELAEEVARAARDYPTSGTYLGVACLTLAVRRPLTRWYVLNIGDEAVEATGLIEMTNLVDRTETAGLSLVYVPQYMDSADPRLQAPDAELLGALMDRGVRRLFPQLDDGEIAYRGLHRTRFVQPLPLVRAGGSEHNRFPSFTRPFQVLNTSMLTCATLNNNEVVGLVERFVSEHREALDA
jgi:protoporphyrinogen oxidase